ncbi:stage III sporulation protein AE [Mobilisporobacter senegalensis]|uniref:Stage III sporulation protein AE n=1 Tax=Mobilisporobacter senegalensis TaxID=1329262 RepID=A0A3N1XKB4_9FIRM|nr:stage III sporulation protein AE [Mobilisporobacter senegalensis]ROR27133.1 stage III sporulation protein AE [Mobilisporobacter senegalensis]
MKIFNYLFVCLIFVLFLPGSKAYAMEEAGNVDYYNDFDYEQIQSVIEDIMPGQDEIDFESYVSGLISGEKEISPSVIMNDLKDTVITQFQSDVGSILRLLSVVIIAALFTNFSNIFHNNQVSETSFYITYILLFSLITSSFITVTSLAGNTLSKLLDFMKALVPTYFLSIAFCSGSKTSLIFYEATLIIITAVDFLLIKLIIPCINIYLILTLANNISKEDHLSKLTDLMEVVIKWSLKTLLAAVIGFNAIQGMIVPAVDSMKKSFLLRASGSLPGIGDALESVTKTIYGAGVLVKNAIGVTGLVVILIIVAVPLIKLTVYAIVYRMGVAVIQPITDKRILNCMNGVSEATGLLLYTVFIGAVLFFITIAIITTSTNFGLSG